MGNSSSRHARFATLGFAVYGACALIAQLAVFQELLIIFAGHELFLGFSLASWMGWVGAGSWLVRHLPHAHLSRLVALLIPLLIANVVAIRFSKLLFGFGMLIGLLPTLILTVLLLAPVGLVAGACFTWGCARVHGRHGTSIGAAYCWETLGAVIGGLAFTAYIAGRLSTDWILALLSAPVGLVLLCLITPRARAVAVALVTILIGVGWAASPLPRVTRAAQWHGYEFLAERASRYSHLVLARTGSLTSYFDSGVIAAHFPDPAAYEELVHWPLLTHPRPERILVIGGAATGTLTELLKHPVRHIDFVERDPAVIELLEPALNPDDRASLRDPRVTIIHQDGRRWLGQAGRAYDVILLQLPEPSNAQINRFYTLEAFEAAARRLAPGGLFAFSIPSSENYLSPETAYFNACLYRTLKATFEQVELIAGDPLLLMGSRQPIAFTPRHLLARYAQRRLATRVVTPGYMPIKLDPARRRTLLATLEATRAVPLNRDFLPICYAYAWRVWLSKFVSPVYFLGSLGLAALVGWLLWFTWTRRATIRRSPQVTALFAMGAAGLIYETILVLAFQAINGYVYWQLGTLFAAFMLGLALGSGLIVRYVPPTDPARSYRALRLLLGVTGLQGLSAVWLLPRFQQLAPTAPHLALFGAALLVTALGVGMAFPLAAHLAPPEWVARTAGGLYAADLWGAALGATFTSAALVPLIGLTASAALIGGVLLLSAGLLPALPRAT